MEKSIKDAFTFMFKDSDWKYKLFVLSALAFPTAFLSFQGENLKSQMTALTKNVENFIPILWVLILILIFVVACTFLFEGYCCKCTHNVIYKNKQSPKSDLLPKWENEFWEYSKIGVNFSIGVSFLGLAVVLGSLLIVPILFYIVGYIALKTLFCVDFKMSAFFAWGKAIKLMKSNPSHYLVVMLCSFALYAVFGLVAYVCSKSLPLVFVASFVQAYIYLVIAYLRGSLFPVTPVEFFETE